MCTSKVRDEMDISHLTWLLRFRAFTHCKHCSWRAGCVVAALAPARQASSGRQPPPPPADRGFTTDENKYVHVWADGACRSNGRRDARAGIGVWFGPGHRLNVSELAAPPATNNSAELQAAGRALRLARQAGFSRVLVHTDSRFVIECATRWLRVWRKNGWRLAGGGPVKNRAQLEQLARAMDDVTVKWNHVRGHSGDGGNAAADRLAVAAAQLGDGSRTRTGSGHRQPAPDTVRRRTVVGGDGAAGPQPGTAT
ncbi:ribonuclease H1-like isoform X1 [Amphibalanus amphitrite]|uniref:ribonuclease H1-like isoform X1 n=2 Tax=Amphibalanus amphitrite TaxID=1232801 RepID=UPI001C8FF989|nr:ribonuclease H1-like isoform X1 [Amphibalanus amphitrite]